MGFGRLNGHIQGGTGRIKFRAIHSVKCKSAIQWTPVEEAVQGKNWSAKQGMIRGSSDDLGDRGEGSMSMSCKPAFV